MGKIPILADMFQKGWNHHLDKHLCCRKFSMTSTVAFHGWVGSVDQWKTTTVYTNTRKPWPFSLRGKVTQVTIFCRIWPVFWGEFWFRNQGTEKTKEKTLTIGFSELQFFRCFKPWPFLSPNWRSLTFLQGSLNHPKNRSPAELPGYQMLVEFKVEFKKVESWKCLVIKYLDHQIHTSRGYVFLLGIFFQGPNTLEQFQCDWRFAGMSMALSKWIITRVCM